jgi:hypothetical protein
VVVDDVEDHLEAGGVQRPDHALDLVDDVERVRRGGIARLRREEAEGAVAPVVRHPAGDEPGLLADGLDRQQLDRRDTELQQVLDGRGVAEARVRAAQRRRDAGQPPGEPLDVGLVHDGVRERNVRRRVPRPVERTAGDDAVRHEGRRVAPVADIGVAREALVDGVAEGLRPQVQPPVERSGVRIEEQLGGVVAVTQRGLPAAGGAVAVPRADVDTGDEAVPDAVRPRGQFDLALDPAAALRGVQQAEPDTVRVGREDGDLRPAVPQPQAERVGSDPGGGVGGHGRSLPHDAGADGMQVTSGSGHLRT